ncbi:protein SOB FIVE-LIKE 1-like [Andrographis paniculata]|uniref:protein SOB FIVE-LIKE 1-like n=1 Tax=Andrographis paniculata TaxID=175694 RepID=UPI0021E6D8E4|nr:protein SOB FIVE-LIKE 1-like [Andrographis paniculata]
MESPSKFAEGTGECSSSSESGWTLYIVSPDHDNDDGGGSDDDEDCVIGNQIDGYKKGVDEDVESDDSMASDASSGPSDPIIRHGWMSRGSLLHAGKKDEGDYVGKKHKQQVVNKYNQEKGKAGKGTPVSRANSAERSKKT